MTNFERLARAGIIKPNAKLSQKQKDALESLSTEDLKKLASVKKKLGKTVTPIDGLMGYHKKEKR
jgi:hypothetical protein